MTSEITIVVQGPLNKNGLLSIPSYLKYGSVIFSTWEADWSNPDLQPEKEYFINHFNNDARVTLILSKYPEIPEPSYKKERHRSYYCQVASTLVALTSVTTDFAIKVRSDEFYDLDPVLASLQAFPNKIVTVAAFAAATPDFLVHISDHLIAGPSRVLKNAFESLSQEKRRFKTPEANITDALLAQLCVDYDRNLTSASTLKHLDDYCIVLPFSKFSRFLFTFRVGRKFAQFYSKKKLRWDLRASIKDEKDFHTLAIWRSQKPFSWQKNAGRHYKRTGGRLV